MRLILSVPVLALVIAAYNIFAFGAGMLDAESLLASWVLPSETEVFFKIGDVFIVAGLIALFFEILKAARSGAGTIIDHMLSTAVFIVALHPQFESLEAAREQIDIVRRIDGAHRAAELANRIELLAAADDHSREQIVVPA